MTRDRSYDYYIDAQGAWFCEGNPVTDRELMSRLSCSLRPDGPGYKIVCEGEVHPVRAADAPLTVASVDLGPEGGPVGLTLTDGRRFDLPDNLLVGPDNVLYARLGRHNLLARFERRPYYELTKRLAEDEAGFFIPNGSGKCYIRPR